MRKLTLTIFLLALISSGCTDGTTKTDAERIMAYEFKPDVDWQAGEEFSVFRISATPGAAVLAGVEAGFFQMQGIVEDVPPVCMQFTSQGIGPNITVVDPTHYRMTTPGNAWAYSPYIQATQGGVNFSYSRTIQGGGQGFAHSTGAVADDNGNLYIALGVDNFQQWNSLGVDVLLNVKANGFRIEKILTGAMTCVTDTDAWAPQTALVVPGRVQVAGGRLSLGDGELVLVDVRARYETGIHVQLDANSDLDWAWQDTATPLAPKDFHDSFCVQGGGAHLELMDLSGTSPDRTWIEVVYHDLPLEAAILCPRTY